MSSVKYTIFSSFPQDFRACPGKIPQGIFTPLYLPSSKKQSPSLNLPADLGDGTPVALRAQQWYHIKKGIEYAGGMPSAWRFGFSRPYEQEAR
jgi:hypothetical protein